MTNRIRGSIVVTLSLALALASVQAVDPPEAGAATTLSRDIADDVASTQQRATASMWSPPEAPSTLPDFVDPLPAYAPHITSPTGALSATSIEPFGVGEVSLGVDRVGGQLVVVAEDLSMPGAGETPVSFSRAYDSTAAASTPLGLGWTSNIERGLTNEGADAVVWRTDGSKTVFASDGSGGYSAADDGSTFQRGGESVERTYLLTAVSGDRLYFSAMGYLTAALDRQGNGPVFRYDDSGKTILEQDPVTGRNIAFEYTEGWLSQARDFAGRIVDYQHDSEGRLIHVTTLAGGVTTFGYDDSGRISAVTAPSSAVDLGTLTAIGYDESGRVDAVSQESGSRLWGARDDVVTRFSYDDTTTVVTDTLGNPVSHVFDEQERETGVTDAEGHTSSVAWADGSPTSVTDAADGVQSIGYDGDGNVTATAIPTGATTGIEYATSGTCASSGGDGDDPHCVIDPEGNRTAIDYGAPDEVTAVRDGEGVVGSISYASPTDAASCSPISGLLCSTTDGNGVTTVFGYDARGDLATVSTPLGDGSSSVTTYSADSLGRITSISRSSGGAPSVTTLAYDTHDNVVHMGYPDGSEGWFEYTVEGSLASSLRSAELIRNEYDSFGRLTKQSIDSVSPTPISATATATATATASRTLDYDAVGNLTASTDDSGTTNYTYSKAGQLLTLQEPGGECGENAHGCTTFDYDADGREVRRTFPGGASESFAYDASSRVVSLDGRDATELPVVEIDYSYADASARDTTRISSRTSRLTDNEIEPFPGPISLGVSLQSTTTSSVTRYDYDTRGRLTAATETDDAAATIASWAYRYDGANNRLSQTRSGRTSPTTDAATPASTVDYTYDAMNRITSTTADTNTWAYDAAGNQTANGITGISTAFDEATLTAQSTAEGATQPITTPDGERIGYRDDAGSHYFLSDIDGSVIGVFASNGSLEGTYRYSPFGETASMSQEVAANPFRYLGQYQSSADVYTLGARSYDAGLGRFTSADPSAQGERSYGYAFQDPINFVDTNGFSAASVNAAWAVRWGVVTAVNVICLFTTFGVCLAVTFLGFFASAFGSGLAAYSLSTGGPGEDKYLGEALRNAAWAAMWATLIGVTGIVFGRITYAGAAARQGLGLQLQELLGLVLRGQNGLLEARLADAHVNIVRLAVGFLRQRDVIAAQAEQLALLRAEVAAHAIVEIMGG